MEEANRKRITAKSWLTRATNKLRQLLDSGEFTQISLVAQIEEFKKRLGNLDEAQSLVEEHIEIEKLEDDIEAAAQFREEKLVTLLAAREKQVSTAELDNLSQEKTESSTSERVQPSGQVSRLPKLELLKFIIYTENTQSGRHSGTNLGRLLTATIQFQPLTNLRTYSPYFREKRQPQSQVSRLRRRTTAQQRRCCRPDLGDQKE